VTEAGRAAAQFIEAWQTMTEAQRDALRRAMYAEMAHIDDELRMWLERDDYHRPMPQQDRTNACLQGDDMSRSRG
jgi:acyl-CoA reductase-like NAD-dependent aldehyde dehydrogenase